MVASQKLCRSYVRPSRNHSADMQRKLLAEAGYPPEKCYVEGSVGLAELLKAIAGRSYRIGVTTLGRFGSTRPELKRVMLQIIEGGSTIHEVTTGRMIATKGEAIAAAMALDASGELIGDARGHTSEEARKRGRKGGKVRAARLADEIAANRMPDDEARKIWTNPRSRMTGPERLALMRGWNMSAAYAAFGPRGAAAGRPRKGKQ